MAEIGACAVPPGVRGLAQASRVVALLPVVVSVDSPVEGSTSQGSREARLSTGPRGSVQPRPAIRQPMTELPGVFEVVKTGLEKTRAAVKSALG